MVFADVYDKVMSLGTRSGLRFVAINRRGYPGSTPFSNLEMSILETGSHEQRAAFIHAQGAEIMTFIYRYVQQHGIPSLSDDGSSGGFAIMGWSAGVSTALAAIAVVDTLPKEVSSVFKANLRALIMHGTYLGLR